MLNIRFIIKMLGMMFILDMIYAMKENDHKDLIERMESRHSLRQLSYMKEMTSIRFFSRVVSCSERESFLC